MGLNTWNRLSPRKRCNMNFMVRILPNNKILVRDMTTETSTVLKAGEVSKYFAEVLQEQLDAREKLDANVRDVKGIK